MYLATVTHIYLTTRESSRYATRCLGIFVLSETGKVSVFCKLTLRSDLSALLKLLLIPVKRTFYYLNFADYIYIYIYIYNYFRYILFCIVAKMLSVLTCFAFTLLPVIGEGKLIINFVLAEYGNIKSTHITFNY